MPTSDLVPILWPREWTSPARLELLKDTPVNCLVMPWAAAPAELAPVAAAAQHVGLEVVTDMKPQPREAVNWSAPGSILAVGEGVWPKVASRAGDDSAEAGPTGLPWIDSNGWFIQLAKAKAPGKAVWIHAEPPPETLVRAAAYSVAVADCEAYGARWLISLDPQMERGLAGGNSDALRTWRELMRALAFFRKPDAAPGMEPRGLLGALSGFAGDNETFSHEFLNLIAREYVPVRILLKSAMSANAFNGLRMVVYLDREPPPAPLRERLNGFVRAGGTLVFGRGAGLEAGSPVAPVTGLDYEMRRLGNGWLALARDDFDDPFRTAADAHVILGRRRDLIRLANAGSMNAVFEGAKDRKRARLRLINYAGRPGLNPVTITLLDRYRSASLRIPGSAGPVPLPIRYESGRTALYLPGFEVCAEVELQS